MRLSRRKPRPGALGSDVKVETRDAELEALRNPWTARWARRDRRPRRAATSALEAFRASIKFPVGARGFSDPTYDGPDLRWTTAPRKMACSRQQPPPS